MMRLMAFSKYAILNVEFIHLHSRQYFKFYQEKLTDDIDYLESNLKTTTTVQNKQQLLS